MKANCPTEWCSLKEEDITVFVDPLDGTREFTENMLENVSVLIGEYTVLYTNSVEIGYNVPPREFKLVRIIRVCPTFKNILIYKLGKKISTY